MKVFIKIKNKLNRLLLVLHPFKKKRIEHMEFLKREKEIEFLLNLKQKLSEKD